MLKLSSTVKNLPPSGIRAFFDLVLSMDDVISLGVGEPDFITPWNISDFAIEKIKQGYTTYTSNSGLLELREAISNYLSETYSIGYDVEDEILITVGVSEAKDLALRALLNKGDEVLVVSPSYVSYSPLVTLAGGIPKEIETTKEEGFKLTPELLTKAVSNNTKAIIFNYPCNPTGTTYSKSELEALAEVFEEKDLVIISDEIYHQLSFDHEHISLPSVGNLKERVLLLNGFSKGYAMTGWRVGYACGPKELIESMTKIHQYSMLCVPTMGQFAAIKALTDGGEAVKEMKEDYKQRRNFIVGRLNEIGLSCHTPGGAFYVFPEIPPEFQSGTDFAGDLLKEEKVAVVPGEAFEKGKKHIRISYASSMHNLQIATDRIERFLKNFN